MNLFGNSVGIAMWDMRTMVNHRQVQKTKERSLLIRRKGESWGVVGGCFGQESIGGNWEWWLLSCWSWQLLIGWDFLIAEQGENLPSGIGKLASSCWIYNWTWVVVCESYPFRASWLHVRWGLLYFHNFHRETMVYKPVYLRVWSCRLVFFLI